MSDGRNTTGAAKRPLVSIVTPAHNEEANVEPLYAEIRRHVETTGVDFELIYVDDGSTDGTAAAVGALMARDPRVRLVSFVRNFGHQAAVVAGMEAAGGDAVITLDCDLQHPPRHLPAMIEAWRAGAEVVQMRRLRTEGAGPWKRLTSAVFYRMINLISEARIDRGVADFRLLDRQIARFIVSLRDTRPFVRGMVGWLGANATTLDYHADARHAGQPSYTFRSSARLAMQATFSMSTLPLRFSIWAGMFLAFLLVAYGIWIAAAFLRGETIPGWSSVILSVLAIGSFQLLFLGVLGEYIRRLFEMARGVPRYVAAQPRDFPPRTTTAPADDAAANESEVAPVIEIGAAARPTGARTAAERTRHASL